MPYLAQLYSDALIALPTMLAAALAGGLIGLEREWRGRSAGFRTHILVAVAACVLLQAAVRQDEWAIGGLPRDWVSTDPVRMAHGVLTGIGFLCGGVIFRTGFSVHGLTTAASLWVSSAIGVLFGVGMQGLAVLATVTTLVILGVLRIVSQQLPSSTVVYVSVSWSPDQPGARGETGDLLKGCDAGVKPGERRLSADSGLWRQTWRLRLGDDDLDDLADRLAAVEGVRALRIDPRED